MTAFFGFGATPHRQHGSPSERARSPLAPLCIVPSVCAATPSSRLSGHPADVGPEGYSPFLGHISCACAKPGTGPVLHYSRHLPQHTMPGSGRAPGPPAGPGWIFSHRSSVFPSFGDSFGAPHPGICAPLMQCTAYGAHMRSSQVCTSCGTRWGMSVPLSLRSGSASRRQQAEGEGATTIKTD